MSLVCQNYLSKAKLSLFTHYFEKSKGEKDTYSPTVTSQYGTHTMYLLFSTGTNIAENLPYYFQYFI